MITIDVCGPKGFEAKFPYDPGILNQVKLCLGFHWDGGSKSWKSEGPDVLLDMERWGIKYQVTPPALARISEYYDTVREIIASKAAPSTGSYAYQDVGAKVLGIQGSGILADEMGLGKSKQSLEAAEIVGAKKILIVVPKTLIYNWGAEVAKWHPDWDIEYAPIASGGKKAREEQAHTYLLMKIRPEVFDKPTVFIVHYEAISSKGFPQAVKWDALILDEAQRFKNKQTMVHHSVKKIADRSKYVWALTGTPLEIRIEETFGIFSVVRPSVFGDFARFRDQHLVVDWWGTTVGIRNEDTFKERIGVWMTRRTKADVASQLPPKVYTEYCIELSAEEKAAYAEIAKGFDTWLNGKLTGSADLLTQMIRFEQFTSSPMLLGIPTLGRGGKFAALGELLDPWPGKVLIFSRFKEMVKLLMEWLGLDPRATITGDVTDPQERLRRVDDFNAGNLGKVFIGTDAAAFGLNITGADLIVHYDKLWNPAKEWQREDRLHRIGQTKTVNVVHMLCNDTIDQGMHEVTKARAQMFRNLIDAAETAVLEKYNIQDYRNMVWGKK